MSYRTHLPPSGSCQFIWFATVPKFSKIWQLFSSNRGQSSMNVKILIKYIQKSSQTVTLIKLAPTRRPNWSHFRLICTGKVKLAKTIMSQLSMLAVQDFYSLLTNYWRSFWATKTCWSRGQNSEKRLMHIIAVGTSNCLLANEKYAAGNEGVMWYEGLVCSVMPAEQAYIPETTNGCGNVILKGSFHLVSYRTHLTDGLAFDLIWQ